MSEAGPSTDELALAVYGLGGLVGFVLMPTLGAWLRVLLRWLESDRSGLAPRRSLLDLTLVRAVLSSVLCSFLVVSLVRASGDLREVRSEAPVFANGATGLLVGALFWTAYALALRTVRKDWQRRRHRGLDRARR